jgi:methyltransferase (TIGR00027 family)
MRTLRSREEAERAGAAEHGAARSVSRASRTARMVAAYRGRASVWATPIVSDPWAAELAGVDGERDADVYDSAHAHMELFIAVRTAFLDRRVERALDDGIAQVVLLGAGYDTRAARLAREGVTFYELDQPGTQRDKIERLRALDGYPLEAATHVACDFERQDFVARLREAGFETDRPAVFVWEGVVYYLTEAAVRATLRRIGEACHPASRVFFDYVSKRFVRGDVKDEKDLEARDRIASMGEPLRFGVDDVLPLLYAEGFRYVRTESFDEMCLALTGTYDRSRKFRFQSIAEARVRPPGEP